MSKCFDLESHHPRTAAAHDGEDKGGVILAASIGPKIGRVAAFRTIEPDQICESDAEDFGVGTDDFQADYSGLVDTCLNVAGGEPIKAMGVAVAGKVTLDRTRLAGAGSLVHWVGRPVTRKIATDLNCERVVLDNDAVASALAETMFGRGPAYDFWYIYWGDGIGGCQVIRHDSKPFVLPSELGHQSVDPAATETSCGCGVPGCLESLAGGWSLARFGYPAERLSPEQWSEVTNWMTTGLYNTLVVRPSRSVVFGGAVAAQNSWIIGGVEQRLREKNGMAEQPVIRLSDFGESAGTIGALALLCYGSQEQ